MRNFLDNVIFGKDSFLMEKSEWGSSPKSPNVNPPLGLISSPRHFADGISLFSPVNDINLTASQMNKDLKLINDWAYQWKIQFNLDPLEQAQEVIFSRKQRHKSS